MKENNYSYSGYGWRKKAGLGPGRFRDYDSQPPAQQSQPFRMPTGTFKVAVATEGTYGLDDIVSPMFGRCPTFTIVTIEGNNIKDVKVIQNQAAFEGQGAGIVAVQTLANEGVNVVLAGKFGPHASQSLMQFGIQIIMVPPAIHVRDAINSYIFGHQ